MDKPQSVLLNKMSNEVLRVHACEDTLQAIADSMNFTLGCNRYTVLPMTRHWLGDAALKAAIEVRWQQQQRAQSSFGRERELTSQRLTNQLSRFLA